VPGKISDRLRERRPSATTTTSKVRTGPCAKVTVTPRSSLSRATIWLPKTYSVSSRVRSTMMRDSWPRRISSSAVAPPESDSPAANRATVGAVGVDELGAGLTGGRRADVVSMPMRRATSRPAPRTSMFWPSSRSSAKRSTTVVVQPWALSQ
jgi:hypothetical protein